MRNALIVGAVVLGAATLGSLPFWGMGPAVFLDSERTVVSRYPSADGKRIAQIERVIVGGAPSIVVTVRPWWTPNWYLAGCAAASHYHDVETTIAWTSANALMVRSPDKPLFWQIGDAPFHARPCPDLTTTIVESEAARPNASPRKTP